ncbi:hypothetical protein CYMTET_8390 [Cymbomonas tetramitiformis]|uniref:Amidoligase enzyme n=1 Tax=Cymbomonas tetramitiformis TaxID=36881 RepID=A0AAE0GT85_9CHLO|nr:hypothetical protein CYMTET_8390 [Cymbomonas tetramitiformis]
MTENKRRRMGSTVRVKIGNTYERLRPEDAPLSRDGHKKVHEWNLYVEVTEGNADIIHQVALPLPTRTFGIELELTVDASWGLECIAAALRKRAGFHVHVSVEDLNLLQMKKVCQNFIKFEEVFDSLVPLSRRANEYCSSNRRNAVLQQTVSNKEANVYLASRCSLRELSEAMNPAASRYHKLNLQPLIQLRQPTFEFRQHSSTHEYGKVGPWIRLLVLFVENSARLKSPQAFLDDKTVDHKFAKFFEWVIKDRYLRDFYVERSSHLTSSPSCCNGCEQGHTCSAGVYCSSVLPFIKR